MKIFIGAIALIIAAPVAAQTAPAPAPKAECCEKMKAEGKECCCKGKDHSKMDHSKHGAGSDAPAPAGEQGHDGHAH